MTRPTEAIWHAVNRRIPLGIEAWSLDRLWHYADNLSDAHLHRGDIRRACQHELITRAFLANMTPDTARAYRARKDGVITDDEFALILGPAGIIELARTLVVDTIVATVRRLAAIEGAPEVADAILSSAKDQLRLAQRLAQ